MWEINTAMRMWGDKYWESQMGADTLREELTQQLGYSLSLGVLIPHGMALGWSWWAEDCSSDVKKMKLKEKSLGNSVVDEDVEGGEKETLKRKTRFWATKFWRKML